MTPLRLCEERQLVIPLRHCEERQRQSNLKRYHSFYQVTLPLSPPLSKGGSGYMIEASPLPVFTYIANKN